MRKSITTTLAAAIVAVGASAALAQSNGGDQWKPVPGHIMSAFAAKVTPEHPLNEYPRPQMERPDWTNLNGLWDYAITDQNAEQPTSWDGKILVPFAPEAALSGVGKSVSPQQKLWYHRTFAAPDLTGGKRLILHFGSIDFASTVMVNGKQVGTHKGGSEPLEYDVTDALNGTGEQTVVVGVTDPTDQGAQPRGKQVLNPNGIWYTPVTGIWKTAWMEAVPTAHVRSMKMVPDVDAGVLNVTVDAGDASGEVTLTATDGGTQIATATGRAGQRIALKVPDAKLWSPDSPHLYDLQVKMGEDSIKSYFGMRKIEVKKDAEGVDRLFLNGAPIFMYGPLDQGWWPGGLLTPPSDEAIKFDIEMTRKMGFNMARKHIKVEPQRWYYWADRMGLLVWQDMPSGMAEGRNQGVGNGGPDATTFTDAEKEQYKTELKEMIDTLGDHPSIVVWVPFNEGWGQHDTNDILKWTMQYDPSRVVDGPSGWQDRGVGDLHDMHNYPGPGMYDATAAGRASVLGEFGGLGLPVEGHLWQSDKNWGYQSFGDKKALEQKYDSLVARLRPLINRGLSAAVYTQTTDVEGEVNGLMTYDRKVIKMDPAHLAKIHAKLYVPAGDLQTVALLPTSEQQPQTWSYTFAEPYGDWNTTDYKGVESWKTGPAGFGTKMTPNTHVRTEWDGQDIWLRKTFTMDNDEMSEPYLRIYQDDDTEVYLNGAQIGAFKDYSGQYVDVPLSEEQAKSLKKGENVIAIHTHQKTGGQYIDAGLVDLRPKK